MRSLVLQLGKLDLIRSGKADQFNWAGFVLTGDRSPIDFSEIATSAKWTWVAVFVLVAGLIAINVYRNITSGLARETQRAFASDSFRMLP